MSERFIAQEQAYANRYGEASPAFLGAWEVWDCDYREIAEPAKDNSNLTQAEAEQRAHELNGMGDCIA